MWRHRSVSLNNEKICCEISEDKIAVCEKTAGLRRGTFLDSNSACLKVLVPVKIFQFQDMLNESERYQDAANGLFQTISLKVSTNCSCLYRFCIVSNSAWTFLLVYLMHFSCCTTLKMRNLDLLISLHDHNILNQNIN